MIKKTLLEKKYLSKTPVQTKRIGNTLAKTILNFQLKKDKAFVLGLKGDLGGGKTTFLQGFARGLGVKEKILSPTFVILKKFEINPSSSRKRQRNQLSGELQATAKFKIFYHIDCYRIKKTKEILDLGFKEITFNPQNIVAVEWADRISEIMPSPSLILHFRFIDIQSREITISNS